MGKYHDFLEAYQKAYAHVRRQLLFEQANKLWKDLKLDPHLWEEKYKMKMNELKLLAIKNHGENLKYFSQTKLSFAKATTTVTHTDLQPSNVNKDSPTESENKKPEESQVPISNEDGKLNSGRFYRKVLF